MQSQARQPQRVETTPEPVYSIHFTSESLHDLTGPINQMCSLADLIVKRYGGELDDDAEALFGFFRASANRLQNLLGGLRTFIRVTGSSKPYQHCEGDALLAASMAPLAQEITRAGATVTHDHLPELFCDPVQISRVFAELIDNAIKFRGERTPEIHVSSSSQDDVWLLSIRDNGKGIPAQQSERVFAMFYRPQSDPIPGAGVGLAIARRIMELHGGSIWVESELGYGATFFLRLPKNHK